MVTTRFLWILSWISRLSAVKIYITCRQGCYLCREEMKKVSMPRMHYAISGPQGNKKHIRRTKGCTMCVSIPLLYWPMMLVFYQLYPSMASHCSQLCSFWCAFLFFLAILAILAILAVDCVMFCPFDRLVFSPLRFCCSASTGLSEGEDAKELGILGVNLSEQYVATYILPILPICCRCCLEHPWSFLTQGHW